MKQNGVRGEGLHLNSHGQQRLGRDKPEGATENEPAGAECQSAGPPLLVKVLEGTYLAGVPNGTECAATISTSFANAWAIP